MRTYVRDPRGTGTLPRRRPLTGADRAALRRRSLDCRLLVNKYDLRAAHSDRFSPKGGLSRDVLERFAEQGIPMVGIAQRLGVSVSTVRYWVTKHQLTMPTARGERTRRARAARDAGVNVAVMECPIHGETEFRIYAYGRSRCLRCRAEAVIRRRRKVKRILVEEAGGQCALCRYNRCVEALGFHHLEPSSKAFAISHRGVTRALDSARREAAKCVLLCANCHAEVEAGHVALGDQRDAPHSGVAQLADALGC